MQYMNFVRIDAAIFNLDFKSLEKKIKNTAYCIKILVVQ